MLNTMAIHLGQEKILENPAFLCMQLQIERHKGNLGLKFIYQISWQIFIHNPALYRGQDLEMGDKDSQY